MLLIMSIHSMAGVRNDDLRVGLGIKTVEEETECLAKKYKSRLKVNADSLARNLYILNVARRLGKAHPEDLITAQ